MVKLEAHKAPYAPLPDSKLKHTTSISGQMTGALTIYSATFMRYSLAITPKNYLLFGCHAINLASQVTQGTRWYNFW
jgi:hypothetical protein